MKLIFLKEFKQMFLKERIDRTVIIILVKIDHSGKAFSHYGSRADTYLKIRNMYKNILASEYSILLLISSCTPTIEIALLALYRDCQTGKFVFSYLLACLKSGRSRVIFMNYYRNNNGQRIYYREETEKDIRKSSEEMVGVAFWPDVTQYLR